MDEHFKEFCENYEVRVLNDQKRRAKYSPSFFTDPLRADIVQTTIETEQVYTVEIPEGRLRALMELERRFYNFQRHNPTQIDMFEALMAKEREESYYRHSNAAVQKAYEQYSILLNLAGYQRKI